MSRMFLLIGSLAVTTGFLVQPPVPVTRSKVVLELTLPESEDPPSWGKDQVSRLLIDGKDYSTPRSTNRKIIVPVKADARSVTIEYTFWPLTYNRFIRTRKVPIKKDQTLQVDLRQPVGEIPDKIWVIFVPTPRSIVKAMCQMAKIQKGDVVYDIGCGDGRLVITAVKQFGAARGEGIDLDPQRIKECWANAKKEGVENRVTFLPKDALTIKDFSGANVVFMYLSDSLCDALRPTLQKTLKPGSRIVSHRFLMGPWEPDTTQTLKATDDYGHEEQYDLHLWTVKRDASKWKPEAPARE